MLFSLGVLMTACGDDGDSTSGCTTGEVDCDGECITESDATLAWVQANVFDVHGRRVRRLRGAESFESDAYGQILVVTFEVVRTGGEEGAGDDAEALGWFALDELPPLAFEPNEKAIRAWR